MKYDNQIQRIILLLVEINFINHNSFDKVLNHDPALIERYIIAVC